MNVTVSQEVVSLHLSLDELSALKRSTDKICSEFSRSQFNTRIGFPTERAEVLSNLMLQKLNVQPEQTCFRMVVNMPNGIDDLKLLNNILNEVCNGIRIVNFQESIGFSIESIKAMLSELHCAISEIKNKLKQSEYVHKNTLVSQVSLTNIKELCQLETKGYKVLFYLRSLTQFPSKVGIIIVLNVVSNSGEFSLKTSAKAIDIAQLKNFLNYLEKHLENLNKVNHDSPYFLECQNVFRIQALSDTTLFDSKSSFTLRFMINFSLSEHIKSDTTTYVGAEALVTIHDIEAFTAVMKTSLAKFSPNLIQVRSCG